jgi:hypothetical protein
MGIKKYNLMGEFWFPVLKQSEDHTLRLFLVKTF